MAKNCTVVILILLIIGVCTDFNYSGFAEAKMGAFFGAGMGPIFLDNVECDGMEFMLLQCTARNFGQHNCFHNEDAGVQCLESYPTTNPSDMSDTNMAPTSTKVDATPKPLNTGMAKEVVPRPNVNKLSRETIIGTIVGLLLLVILVIPAVIVVTALVYRLRQRALKGTETMENLSQIYDSAGIGLLTDTLNL